jgi:hypothetical protein
MVTKFIRLFLLDQALIIHISQLLQQINTHKTILRYHH